MYTTLNIINNQLNTLNIVVKQNYFIYDIVNRVGSPISLQYLEQQHIEYLKHILWKIC